MDNFQDVKKKVRNLIKSIDEKFIGTLGVDYSKRKTKLDMESINHLQVHATALGGVLMTHLSK